VNGEKKVMPEDRTLSVSEIKLLPRFSGYSVLSCAAKQEVQSDFGFLETNGQM
jgi:hypothetical protein